MVTCSRKLTQDFDQSSDVFALYLYSSNTPPVFSAGIVLAVPGSGPSITWQVTPGKTYQVQFKNNLTDPAWQPLNGTVTQNGNQAAITDLPPATGQRFYCIVAH